MATDRAIILASSSVSRRGQLTRLGIEFDVAEPNIDETPLANEQATPLMRELFAQLSGGQETRIGRMVDEAFAVLDGSEHAREMMAIYHLFGDPALRVAKVSDTGGTGGSPGVGGSGGNGGVGSGVVMAGCNVRPVSGNTPAALLFIGTLALVLRRRRA